MKLFILILVFIPAAVGVAQDAVEPVIPGSAAWLERVGADNPAAAGLADPAYGAEHNPTGEPIGGGSGYSRIVRPEEADVVVDTADALLAALADAGERPAIIYVADHALIDLTAHDNITIPAHTTLAGGRGRGGAEGALLYSYTVKSTRLFATGGPGVRVSGLRLEGSYPGRERLTQRPTLMSLSHPDAEVDNCEIFGWSCAALGVGSGATEGTWIHHNYIHHNQRAGLGYGVSLGRTHVLIEGNLFDFCRHAIASSGTPGSGYTARYNVHLEHTISHVFDMHGARDFEKYQQVGLWHMDEGSGEKLADYSIYNGTHTGTLKHADQTAWVEGRIGSGVRFDGQALHADLGKQRQLAPESGLTLAAWIRAEAVDGSRAIFSKGDSGRSGGGYALRVLDGTLEGSLYDSAGQRCSTAGGRVETDRWHYVTMTWNGKEMVLYLDGEVLGRVACARRTTSGNNLLLGRDSTTATSFFRGVIDEARVYNRALTDADIRRQVQGHADIAGRLILVHHNTFRPVNYAALGVRGRPSVGCWVHHNRFFAPEGATMVRQSNASGNFEVFDNLYSGPALTPAPDFSAYPLQGHWQFASRGADAPADRAGRQPAAVLHGAAEEQAWETGADGAAFSLAAGSRWVEIPRDPDADFPQRVLFGLRIRLDRLGEHQVLFDNGLFRFYHRGGWAAGKIYFLCRVQGDARAGDSSWDGYAGVVSRSTISAGHWLDLVGERDGDLMRLYLNGQLEREVTCLQHLAPAMERQGDVSVARGIDGALQELWVRAGKPATDAETIGGTQAADLLIAEQETVSPAGGSADTQFTFRVRYRDPQGEEPAPGFPRVHILRDGVPYVNEAPVTMLAAELTPVTQGRLYVYTMRLPRSSGYEHFFEVETSAGATSRTPAVAGPQVEGGRFAPVLSWTSERGYVRDGVEPEIGDVTTAFDFRVLFSDLDGDDPLDGYPKVHISKGGTPIAGSPFAMAPAHTKPTWQGRPYSVELTLPAGSDYSYHFTAKDSEGNPAPDSLARRAPIVDAGADIAPPSLDTIRVAERTATTVTIEWNTDEPALGAVEFGPDTTYGMSRQSTEQATAHRLHLDGLEAGARYHFRVHSVDAAGNRARSGDFTFETVAE